MRNIFLTILLLTITNNLLSQKFSLNELIKLNNANWDDFDTYVTSKGYEYYTTEDKYYSETRAYAYKQSASSKAGYFIAKSIFKQYTKKMTSFQTTKKDEYLAIKNQLKT